MHSAMAVDPACSKENLFVQLVTKRLRSHMDTFWDEHSDDAGYGPGLNLPSNCDDAAVHIRLTQLENTVVRIDGKIDQIHHILSMLASSNVTNRSAVVGSDGRGAINAVAVPVLTPFPALQSSGSPARVNSAESYTSTARSPSIITSNRIHTSAPTGSSSNTSASPSASPSEFQFVCPLCLKPQFTPKSHCEHLRNVVGDGNHICRFVAEHSLHDRVQQLWGCPEQFVRWYCSFLRSGVGRRFTDRDMEDYREVQQTMQGVLNGSMILQL
jgi:hypothetical protein